MKSRPLAIAAVLLILASLASCSRSRESSPALEPTPPLSGGMGFALVQGAYVRLKAAPSSEAVDLTHLRKGEILAVEGRDLGQAGDAQGVWYRLKAESAEGWAREEDLKVFETRAQAELAAKAAP